MKARERVVPFGLLFEEVAPQPQGLVMPTYDEETDLSYVEDLKGHWIPYVEFVQAAGTQTETRLRREETDTDPGEDHISLSGIGTNTFTEVRTESTDTDPGDDNAQSFAGLGTNSMTLIASESTDTDPEDDRGRYSLWMPLAGTDTITKVKRETTDRD